MAYVYSKAAELKGKPVVGTRQCVALVQEYAGAPVTSRWRQGEAVLGNEQLKTGTAIATFVKGRYANRSHGNHAALYVRQGLGGIYVVDQWKAEGKTKISMLHISSLGKDKNGNFRHPSDNADAFFVIE
ncbi:BPSL0067 family protein [Pseudoduganella sp. RAF53_2]|uniref:BPSL0067 family protein n=1 Tax=unclassified Pseudoduganella TaxID=2637179 RepID=UPI003F99D5C8